MTTIKGKPKTKRFCLKCKRPFRSEGNHNRLCGVCRDDNIRISARCMQQKPMLVPTEAGV